MGRLRVLAAVLAALLLVGTAAAREGFPDVVPGAWYYEHVTEMTREGLLSGYPDGSFRPNAPISAALKPGTPANRAWEESDLSESGKFVFSRFAS